MLASLQTLAKFSEMRAVVVDNASGEEHLHILRGEVSGLQNVELLESSTNRGYFGAARFGLDRYLSSGHNLPDWVIVCNHDVVIQNKEFLSKLLLQDPSSLGVIAPRIHAMPGDVDQNPFMQRRPGWLRWMSLRFIYSAYGVNTLWHWLARQKGALRSILGPRIGKFLTGDSINKRQIYAPHGAFIIFSRRYFELGGELDGNLFLYFEEISVAEICRSLGLRVVYDPSFCVVHNEHQSTGERVTRFSYECHTRALRYVRSRYLLGSQESLGSCRPDLVP